MTKIKEKNIKRKKKQIKKLFDLKPKIHMGRCKVLGAKVPVSPVDTQDGVFCQVSLMVWVAMS